MSCKPCDNSRNASKISFFYDYLLTFFKLLNLIIDNHYIFNINTLVSFYRKIKS